MTFEDIALYNFVWWLIHQTPEDRFTHRGNICETVRRYGKEKILDELERQSRDMRTIGEAVILTQTIRGMH